LGPPGSGKGTQSAKLSEVLRIPAISTGEILRRACQSGSELGRTVQAIITAGQLVGDDLMNQVIASRIREEDCGAGCILDGYPRTVSQAHFLDELLNVHGIPQPTMIDFAVSTEEIVARLSRRRQCGECGKIFGARPGRGSFRCDVDGSILTQRADDHPKAIRARLKLYRQNARDLYRYYRRRDYHRIDAARCADEVLDEIMTVLGRGERRSIQKIGAAALTATAAY
jgi:adenylate kinase